MPLPKNLKHLRQNMTKAEKLLWSKLKAKQFHGLKFRKQAPIENYIVDFLCFEKRLIVELDGGQHNIETDKPREDDLRSKSFHIIRFWNNDVLNNLEGVLKKIEITLGLSEEHPPQPLPQGGA